MSKYLHLFFDLDNTLIDFRATARLVFRDILGAVDPGSAIPDADIFTDVFEKHNDELWRQYRQGQIKKDRLRSGRFLLTLRELGIGQEALSGTIEEMYMKNFPEKAVLFPQAKETLAYLGERYKLYILTNGFIDMQIRKLSHTGIRSFFSKIFMAEMTGYQKPDRRFFEYAVKSVHAHKRDCLMIGDDPEADVAGARKAGLDQVFFNPCHKPTPIRPTFEIRQLEELRELL